MGCAQPPGAPEHSGSRTGGSGGSDCGAGFVQPDYVTLPGATGGWDWMAEVYRSAGRMSANLMFGEGPASFQPGLSLTADTRGSNLLLSDPTGAMLNWLLEFASTYGVPCAMIVAYLIVRPFTVLNRIPAQRRRTPALPEPRDSGDVRSVESQHAARVGPLHRYYLCSDRCRTSPTSGLRSPERTSAKHAYRLFSRMAALTAVVTAGIFVLGSHFLRDEIDSTIC